MVGNAGPGVEHDLGTSRAAARIRVAASEVFAARGYGAATTREIAASLDLSPGAVYPHYKTKESLLFAIALEGHRAVLEVLEAADDPDTTPTERLMSATRSFVEWHADHQAVARVIQYELRSLDEEHFAAIADVRRATTNVFRRILEAGVTTGEFQLEDVATTTLAITSLGIDVSRWFPSRGHSDGRALATRYAEIALRVAGCRLSGGN